MSKDKQNKPIEGQEDFILKKIRYYQGSIKDFDDFWNQKIAQGVSEESPETKSFVQRNAELNKAFEIVPVEKDETTLCTDVQSKEPGKAIDKNVEDDEDDKKIVKIKKKKVKKEEKGEDDDDDKKIIKVKRKKEEEKNKPTNESLSRNMESKHKGVKGISSTVDLRRINEDDFEEFKNIDELERHLKKQDPRETDERLLFDKFEVIAFKDGSYLARKKPLVWSEKEKGWVNPDLPGDVPHREWKGWNNPDL